MNPSYYSYGAFSFDDKEGKQKVKIVSNTEKEVKVVNTNLLLKFLKVPWFAFDMVWISNQFLNKEEWNRLIPSLEKSFLK